MAPYTRKSPSRTPVYAAAAAARSTEPETTASRIWPSPSSRATTSSIRLISSSLDVNRARQLRADSAKSAASSSLRSCWACSCCAMPGSRRPR